LAAIALLGLAVGMSPAAVLVLECLAVVLLRGWLALRISRRRRAFEDQLPELLNSLGSALRAGHGLNQALAAVAADSPQPVSGELHRVLSEARLGRPLEDALADLGKRIGSEDLDFVLDSVVIQRQVGGSLAGIFDIVGESVRGRQQFALRLRALTAMGRTSGLVLVALPFGIATVMSLLNPAYLSPLFSTSAGHLMLIVSAILMVVGAAWLQKIVSTKG
jgi:tight adherence protein B